MSPRRFCLLAAALSATATLPAHAQLAARHADAPSGPSSAAFAPTAAAAPVALQPARMAPASLTQEQAALQARTRSGFRQSQVLMIVGGAAILTGLIAGGGAKTVLVIGGASVGLYGLYLYLQ